MRDRSNSISTTAQRLHDKGFLGASYCRGGYCHIMSHCCPVRSILIFSLFACGVLSAPTEDQSEIKIYADRRDGMDIVNSEVSDIADFDEIIKDTIYSTTDDTSKVFLKFPYNQLERSRQKRMPPEPYSPKETNQSSSEILDMKTSFVHPPDGDDEIESQTLPVKNSVSPDSNNTCNEIISNNESLPSMESPELPSCPENVTKIEETDHTKEIPENVKPRKTKKYFTSTTGPPQVDEKNPSTTIAMTKNENVSSTDTIKDTSNAQGTSSNRNELENVNQSTEQLNTESSDISSSTIVVDSTESREIIQVIPMNSSTTATTEADDADASTSSITNAETNAKINEEIKKETEAKETGMPSGIIALVIAITFSIAVIIAYVGLIVWRRYLDYRYGNRELLVNDLEFDTNDLRHFEL